jgi:NDP-sugar pyrophosphorylase family protein
MNSTSTTPTLLILAAGMGSRYGGIKQLDEVGPNGEAIIDYSLYDALKAGFKKVAFVIKKDFEKDFRERFHHKLADKVEVEYRFQRLDDLPGDFEVPASRVKPWGTAHAVWTARDAITDPFAVINADDFYGSGAYQTMAEFLKNEVREDYYSMVGYRLDKTLSENGSVSRGYCRVDEEGNLIDIEELTKVSREDDKIIYFKDGEKHELKPDAKVSMNYWGFHPNIFNALEKYFVEFLEEKINVPKSEYFIPIPVDKLIKSGQIKLKVLKSTAQWFGVTYREDKPVVQRKIRELIKQGVYPENLWNK